jgi:hypothetical protein
MRTYTQRGPPIAENEPGPLHIDGIERIEHRHILAKSQLSEIQSATYIQSVTTVKITCRLGKCGHRGTEQALRLCQIVFFLYADVAKINTP